MVEFDQIDFFTDRSVVDDPYPYYEYLREQGPVWRDPRSGLVAVTGYNELAAVYRDHQTFSSINSSLGPFPLPFSHDGRDIGEQIETHRAQFPMSEHLVSFDPPRHTAHRSLLNGLFTPKRLKENEAFMWRLADRLIDEFIGDQRCEFLSAYGQPFPLLVIADLLGVPEQDHPMFRALLAGGGPTADQPWVTSDDNGSVDMNPLSYLDKWFTGYIEDRRANPRDDILTQLASAEFPDGSLPPVVDVVRIATFLFIAGHETTAKLLTGSMRVLAERPELQNMLRDSPERVPNFVEEMLRFEGPIKSDFRMTRVATTLAGVELPAGTTVMLLPGAANRDPDHFVCPAEFHADRPNARHNVSFGRGVHSCPGGPLARIEARVSIERLLERTADLRICEATHGPPGARRFRYVPLWILRGLTSLHLEFTPRDARVQ
ncbi:cytochrome P450 [Mycobacterium palustre]|uniref:Cytochrome n=1 Tax=Mycobacterium palustre TaxID=153971 RepID=A0A1X1ZZ64_9MYCO|nr:cytochrome P450 [Mycobacterium palustre]MCV7100207.1 cytochrome P450 [Mycobacterium palustre]ORW32926.1 cytochrome [Mycobacterium palustre]